MYPEITRDEIRAAAHALSRLADAGYPSVSRAQIVYAFAEIGLSPKQPAAPTVLPGSPPEPAPIEEPRSAAPEGVPQARGPPVPCGQIIWVRPREGARIAGVGLTCFYGWIRAELVRSKRVNGVRLVSVESIRDIAGDPVPTSRPGPRAHRGSQEE